MTKTLPCTDSVFDVPFAGRLGGRKCLLCEAILNQTPTACYWVQQLVTVSGTYSAIDDWKELTYD